MNITESEYHDYMSLIEQEIKGCYKHYSSLQDTLNNWNDIFHPTSKKSGLTITEIKNLQESFKERQYKYFIKWYEMNERLRKEGKSHFLPGRTRELNSYLIEIMSYKELIAK